MKKNNKKKGLLLGIISTLIVAIIGYGVYSYYWAEGDMTTNQGSMSIDGFNVTFYNDGGFIADGANLDLVCSDNWDSDTSMYYYACDAGEAFENHGNTDVRVNLSDVNFNFTVPDGYDTSNVSTSVTWNDNGTSAETPRTIPASGTDGRLEYHINIVFPLGNYNPSGEGEQVSSPVIGGDFTASASFKVHAEQVHD